MRRGLDLFHSILSVTVQPVLGWVSGWLSSFSGLLLAHSNWDQQATDTGKGLGVLIVLLIVGIVCGREPDNDTRVYCKYGSRLIFLALTLAVLCIALRVYQGILTSQGQIVLIRDTCWKWTYVAMLLAIQGGVTLLAFCVTADTSSDAEGS
jgi:hypothetical protein